MNPRQWRILQGLAVLTFAGLWLLGATVLGLTLITGGRGAVEPASAGAVGATATCTPVPTLTPSPYPTPSGSTPSPPHLISPSPSPSPSPLPTPTATASHPTPTAVSLQPVPPAWPTPAPGSPTPEGALPIPTPVPPVEVAPDAVNIVVLGSDRRPEWSEWHTDAIHVVSIQRDRAAVSVLSIPRDLYVYIPGFWMSRINFADYYGEVYGYAGGGPSLVRDTLLYNLGIRIDHYVRTDFDGLIGIVDALGGIDVPVHCRLTDYWPYPDENGEYPIVTLEPGVHHMDGETALWYARSRLTSSVFSRERRQQQVLQAIWHRVRDEGLLSRLPVLWDALRGAVVTDMDFNDLVDVVRVGFILQDQNVRFYNIGRNQVTPWTTPHGGSVFLPRWEAIEPIVAEAMAPMPETRIERTFMPVEVWNGTPNTDWDRLAADRLVRMGFPAIIGQPDRRDYAATQIVVFSEYAKGTGVELLQAAFGVPDARVTFTPTSGAGIGFRLIIGADYEPCYLQ